MIKESHSSEKNQTLLQNPQNRTSKKGVSEKPREGLALLIGQDVSFLEEQLGVPDRIDQSQYGYEWYIYNRDFKHYFQVGVDNKKIVTIYAVGQNLDIAPFEIGQPVEEIYNTQYMDTNVNLDFNGNTYSFELNDSDFNLRPMIQLGDIYAQLYIDKFTGNLSSVRFLDAATLLKLRPYELVYSGELLEAAAPNEDRWEKIERDTDQQIFDITNILRLRHKLKPLKWDEQIAQVAYEHSKDMFENHDSSDKDKKFVDITEQLKKEKIEFQAAGQNIAENYTDGPAVVEGWLNSKGHRESLLRKDFTHLGVGVYRKYYTQNFIQKIDR